MKYMSLVVAFVLTAIVLPAFANAQNGEAADTGFVLPAGCLVRQDLEYKTVGDWKGLLDLYLPADTAAPVPLVIMFHGGGWNHGKKEDVRKSAGSYLKLGFAVANVEYRLLGTAPAPAALDDARCALLWLVDHAAQYHLDPQIIIPTGTSAGAHLALMIGVLPEGNRFEKDCQGKRSFKIAAIVDKYGIADVRAWLSRTHWLDNVPDKEKLAADVSPVSYIRPGLPPVFIVHGDADPTVPYEQATRLHSMLDSVGVKNVFHTVAGGGHGKFEKDENKKIGEEIKEFLIDVGIPVKSRKK